MKTYDKLQLKCPFRKLNNYAPNESTSEEDFLDCIGDKCAAYRSGPTLTIACTECPENHNNSKTTTCNLKCPTKTKWCCGALPQEVWHDVDQ